MKYRVEIKKLLLCCFTALILCYGLHSLAFSAERWSGVDESVVEKYAKEYGREVREPLINTDQGDLLLFVFLIAGVLGGFVAGYYWRVLTEQKTKERENGDIFRAT